MYSCIIVNVYWGGKGVSEAQKLKEVLDTMEVREPQVREPLRKADPAAPPITRRDVLNCQVC